MNPTLLKLTAFALAAVSGANALDWPFALRGSAEHIVAAVQEQSEESSEDALVALESSDCDKGISMGESSMKARWRKEGSDCANAWNVDSMARSVKRKYPRNGRNWRETTKNQCAQRGIDREVNRIKKRCFEDNPSQCTGLGEAAAAQIVLADVCKQYSSTSATSSYERSCRKLAYSICEGQIATQIQKYCPREMPSTSRLRSLGRKCPRKVDQLTGRNEIGAADV